jgi:hypothetical protein
MRRKFILLGLAVAVLTFGLLSCGGAPRTGVVITPDTPASSQVSFVIDSTQDNRAISPFIYSINFHNFAARPANIPQTREGGNRWSAYNWENNASNAGTDWLNQNDGNCPTATNPARRSPTPSTTPLPITRRR